MRDFERVQSGVSRASKLKTKVEEVVEKRVGEGVGEKSEGEEKVEEKGNGTKRKFSLDEDEMLRIAQGDREKARRVLAEERDDKARKGLRAFWVPSLTPGMGEKVRKEGEEGKEREKEREKRGPVCPASKGKKSHGISLKGLTEVRFTEEEGGDGAAGGGDKVRVCPCCKKGLSNASKATCESLFAEDTEGRRGC